MSVLTESSAGSVQDEKEESAEEEHMNIFEKAEAAEEEPMDVLQWSAAKLEQENNARMEQEGKTAELQRTKSESEFCSHSRQVLSRVPSAMLEAELNRIGVSASLASMTPRNRAEALLGMPANERQSTLSAMSPEDMAAAVAVMSPEIRGEVLAAMSPQNRSAALKGMSSKDRTAALALVSPEIRGIMLTVMSAEDRTAALADMSVADRASAIRVTPLLTVMSAENRSAALAGMSAADRAAAMSPEAIAGALAGMSPPDRAAAVKGMSAEDRAAALAPMSPALRAETLTAMPLHGLARVYSMHQANSDDDHLLQVRCMVQSLISLLQPIMQQQPALAKKLHGLANSSNQRHATAAAASLKTACINELKPQMKLALNDPTVDTRIERSERRERMGSGLTWSAAALVMKS